MNILFLCFGVLANTFLTSAPPVEASKMPYVEFDFSTLTQDGEGMRSLTITVFTIDKDIKYSQVATGPRKFPVETTCAGFANNLEQNKFKAEVVDKTKLRVYGRIFNDKLIPVTKGKVESPDLKPEELPKVTNPKNEG